MSLDTLFKQNKQKQDATSLEDSGEFHSRAEEDTLNADLPPKRTAKSSAKRTANKKNVVDDDALPEKKRARRRLIGAVALVLAAVIGLPMVFDSEPKPTAPKIAIEIPSKDAPMVLQTAPTVATPPASNAVVSPVTSTDTSAPSSLPQSSGNASQGIDKNEVIVSEASLGQNKTSTVNTGKILAATAATATVATVLATNSNNKPIEKKIDNVSASKTAQAFSSATPANKAMADVVKPSEAKAESKAEPKKEIKDNRDDPAKVMAILDGRTPLGTDKKVEAKTKTEKANASYSIQVAALNSASKIKELQGKLKAANIKSFTQKITTKNGEVSRIRVGPFASKAEAEKMKSKLIKLGLNPTLVPN